MIVNGFGCKFPVEYSSCSRLPPKLFRWSHEPAQIRVYIDEQIEESGLESPSDPFKFGWVCESSEICDGIYNKLLNNIELYKIHFRNIFTCDESLLGKDSLFIYAPPGSNLPWTKPEEMQIFEKTKICSMICSPKTQTKGHRFRLEVAGQLRNSIDLFGGAHGSSIIGEGVGPTGDWCRSKLPALKDYRFSLVFENALYDKYYTEKITDCFATGTVPVYWGTRKVGEDFNPRGIIFWEDFRGIDSLTTDLYDLMMPDIIDNFERVKHLVSADDIIFTKITSLISGL